MLSETAVVHPPPTTERLPLSHQWRTHGMSRHPGWWLSLFPFPVLVYLSLFSLFPSFLLPLFRAAHVILSLPGPLWINHESGWFTVIMPRLCFFRTQGSRLYFIISRGSGGTSLSSGGYSTPLCSVGRLREGLMALSCRRAPQGPADGIFFTAGKRKGLVEFWFQRHAPRGADSISVHRRAPWGADCIIFQVNVMWLCVNETYKQVWSKCVILIHGSALPWVKQPEVNEA